jgi:hypothetical protein
MVGMTVASGRNAWQAAGFTGTFSPSGFDPNTIHSQTTTPAASPGDCVGFTTTVSVVQGSAPTPAPTPTPAPCIVPSFVGTSTLNADSTWTTAGFTGQLRYEKQNQRPYTIQTQSLVGGSAVPCTSRITVGPP